MKNGDALAATIQTSIDAGELAGVVALVWREGKVRHVACIGWRDMDTELPVERDTLFRIASMTKPITSTVALMLAEEGRLALDEPIVRWAPEFSQMRVIRSPGGPLGETNLAERQITFEDLLTHRSGLTYGPFHEGAFADAYNKALGGHIDSPVAPGDWIAGLAALPLIDQPGAAFHYGHSTDLLGLLIERIEGAPLGDIFGRRIFGPLGMKDTCFTVPREKRDRRARAYGFDEAGCLIARFDGPGRSFLPERPQDMVYVSGGQGLWSTLDDYLAFARMFVSDGIVDGVRLLQPETLALMTRNHLTDQQRATAEIGGMPLFAAGHGFGLGVAVVVEPDRAIKAVCGGGVGAVGWPGGFGGWWQADPNDGSVLIFLTHNMVERQQLADGIGIGVYGAIMRFAALAVGCD